MVVPSEWERGGKDEEEKLLERFLARCQKAWEELELDSSVHLLLMKECLASRRTDLA